MATGSLYGSVSESTGLYGIGAASGGTYFEWFIFQDSATAPATPTGGSWSFTTNTGTAPTGWVASPPASPVNQVWVSLAIVDSRSTSSLVWTTPGLMSNFGNSVANYLTFVATSAPTYSPGRLWYDTNQKAFAYYNDVTNNVVHIGQETQLKVYNNTGSTITRGSPVYISSTTSGFTYPLVALAKADNQVTGTPIGLANQDIPTATAGYITIAGIVNANTGAFSVGDVLYVSPYSAGQLMNTVPPTGYAVKIGIVAYSNTPNGTIYVSQSNAYVNSAQIVGAVAIANGGTGATTASAARTALGLGTISTQDASNVAITGGSISLTTALPIASGGTAGTTAATARSNLGAVGLTDTQTLTNKTISGASNTFSNIPNSGLTNSTFTMNGQVFTLGAVQTVGANLFLPSYTGNAGKVLALNPSASDVQWISAGGVGTVTSIDISGGTTGLTTFGGPITAAGTITLAGTLAVANGGTGATTAATARTNLGATTVGANMFALTNPSAITFPRFNADNTVSALDAATFRTAIGAGTSSTTGTVTSVGGTGTVNGLTLTGTVTTSGNLTLGGTLDLSSPPAIGGTAAAAGSFTTLSASSTVTLSGGTANGVAYLNGSKVLTTGSALTFTGTALGVNVATPLSALHVVDGGGVLRTFDNTDGIILTSYSASKSIGFSTSSAGNYGSDSGSNSFLKLTPGVSGTQIFGVSGSEQMRLTSTGLGIGTSTVTSGSKLTVAGGNLNLTQSDSRFIGGDTVGRSIFTNSDVTTYVAMYGSSHATLPNVMSFVANGNVLTYNASGNLGLGVTPSAWNGFTGFQVGALGGLNLGGSIDDNFIGSNCYYNAGFKFAYASAAYATAYRQTGGQHRWLTSTTTGTAGNTATMTQAMTLDASGNLRIGATGAVTTNERVTIVSSAADTYTAVQQTSGITAVFGVDANGAYSGSYTNQAYLFKTNNTERARIDPSGNLLVGATSQFGGADCKLQAKNGSSAQAVSFLWNATTTGDANFVAFGTEASVTQRGSITYNRVGGLTAYNTTSDYRAKDISGILQDSGSVIDSVPVYMGLMKGATQERPMFIAHETPAYAHTGVKDAVDKDGNPVYQQMDASALVPVMWAEIQSLRKRLAALEAA